MNFGYEIIENKMLQRGDVIEVKPRRLMVNNAEYFMIQVVGYKHAFRMFDLSEKVVEAACLFAKDKLAKLIDNTKNKKQ